MKNVVSRSAALTIGAALVVLAVAAAARSETGADAARQRVSIVTNESGTSAGEFSFRASGSLRSDDGKFIWTGTEKPRTVRDGQTIAVYVITDTFTGRRGTLTIRERVEVVDAGNGYIVGTGSWSFARGTGAYAGAVGRGRLASVRTPSGRTSARFEGFLRAGS
jgi:hypothetical protein